MTTPTYLVDHLGLRWVDKLRLCRHDRLHGLSDEGLGDWVSHHRLHDGLLLHLRWTDDPRRAGGGLDGLWGGDEGAVRLHDELRRRRHRGCHRNLLRDRPYKKWYVFM